MSSIKASKLPDQIVPHSGRADFLLVTRRFRIRTFSSAMFTSMFTLDVTFTGKAINNFEIRPDDNQKFTDIIYSLCFVLGAARPKFSAFLTDHYANISPYHSQGLFYRMQFSLSHDVSNPAFHLNPSH